MHKLIIPAMGAMLALAMTTWADSSQQSYATDAMVAGTNQTAPRILKQPADISALQNKTATFNCQATGNPAVHYQWYYNGNALTNQAGKITGAQSSTLILPKLQSGQAGSYWLRISNAAGQTNSRTAQLTVLQPAQIVTQPTNVSTLANLTVQFQVQATGSGPLQFQWYRNRLPLPGKTASWLVISNVQTADAGAYQVSVHNAASIAWSTAVKLQVTSPGANETQLQKGAGLAVPHVAARPDGTTWLAWYKPVAGEYQLRLQRMDLAGQGMLGTDGVPASAVNSASWVMDYDLATGTNGNAIVAYSNTKDFSLRAQQFNAQGTPQWGASGIVVSSAGTQAFAPSCLPCPNGDLALSWLEQMDSTNTSACRVCLTRLNSAGQPVWATRFDLPVPIASADAQIIRGTNDSLFLVWMENDAVDYPGDAFALRIDKSGAPIWPAKVKINGDLQLPYPHRCEIAGDGNGGFYATWPAIATNWFVGRVQHINANGQLLWGAGGKSISTSTNTMQIPNAITYSPTQQKVVVAWEETDALQTVAGINAQAFDAQGSALWTGTGMVILPGTSSVMGQVGALRPTSTGAALFFLKETGFGQMTALVDSLPTKASAKPVQQTLSGVLSNKSDPSVTELVGNGYWTAWADNRGGIFGRFWPAP